MLIRALCDYYDILSRKGLVLPEGYSEIPIKYIIALNPDGAINSILSCQIPQTEIMKNGKEKIKLVPKNMIFPKRTEKPGIESNIMEDRALYIFGLNLDKGVLSPNDNTDKAKKSHAAFVESNLRFLEGLDSPVINAFRNFLQNWKPETETKNCYILALGKDYSGARFAFCLSGSPDLLLHEDPKVKEKWERLYKEKQQIPGEHQAQCSVTGEVAEIARIHGKIKGIAGGASTGGVLIGFNNPSENSYGNDQSYNSNVSERAMQKYTEALNYLLKSSVHRIVMDDITIVFWAMDGKDAHERAVIELLLDPSRYNTAENVDAMLADMLQRGMQARITTSELKAVNAELDPQIDFYMAGFKPNSSRISMKFLYRRKFGDVLQNIAKFQGELQMAEDVKVVPLNSIKMNCLSLKENDGKSNLKYTPRSRDEKVNPELINKLMESAMYGKPYPKALLETIIRKIKTDKIITRTRAGVIKACLIRNQKEEMKVSLDKTNTNQAYSCGRLFAVLEKIQKDAVTGGKLNSTIKDKYFASAAAKPANIFPILINLSQHHVKKMNDGSQIFYAKLIGEIMDKLKNEFPKTLALAEQGKFMIGYYHQVQAFYKTEEK